MSAEITPGQRPQEIDSPRAASPLDPGSEIAYERLRLAVRAANIGLWDWDLATNDVYFSPEWKAQIGYADSEIPNRFEEWQNRVHVEDIAGVLAKFRECLEQRARECSVEFRFRHKQGSYRWIYSHGSLVFNGDGQPIRMLGSHIDFTAQRQVEEELRGRQAELVRALAEKEGAELRRQELERSLALLLSNLPGLVYRCRNDSNWSAEFVSEGARQLTGYAPEDFSRNRISLATITIPEDRDRVWEEVQVAVRAHKSFQLKYRICTAGGEEKWVWEQGAAVYDAAGALVALEGFICDLTEQRQAEIAVARERDFSEAVLRSISGVFYMIDEPGRLLRWNRYLEEVTGRTPAELDRMPAVELFGHGDAELIRTRIREVFLKGEAHAEATLVAKEGRATPFYFTGRRITFDGAPCLIGMGIDVSARVETEERFRLLVENSSDLINILDDAGRICFRSPSAERMLGYQPDELTGRSVAELIHPEDWPRIRDLLGRLRSNPALPVAAEFRCRHRDGSWRILESLGKSIPGKPGERLILVNSRDVTESRRTAEQSRQSQKLEAIGRLSGGVAHDFNNILTVIQGQASLVQSETGLPPAVSEALVEITSAADRAAHLTRQLLTFSRRQTVHMRDIDLNDVVGRTAGMLQRMVGEDVRISVTFASQALVTHADPGMLDQVLLNLAGNARDAMPKGGQLVIQTTASDLDEQAAAQMIGSRPGSFVCLTVTDTGSGIPGEHLSRIFDPFFTTKEVGKGTGLGLATVYGIVQQHLGWITVSSEPARGSTFRIFLPRLMTAAKDEPREVHSLDDFAGKETILLVEDEISVRALVKAVLCRLGYSVLEASSGVAALTVWREHQKDISLLLTDLVMPEGMTGIDLAQRLRIEAPHLKVIFTSGYSAEVAGRDTPLTEGANFVQKPYHPSRLAQTIRRALDRR